MSRTNLPEIQVNIGDLGGLYAVPGTVYASKIAYYANVINNTLDNSLEDVETPLTELKTKEPTILSPVVSDKLDIIIQEGHIGRTKGATGAYREQEFTKALGDAMKPLLDETSLNYRIMEADNWLKPEPNQCKIFMALHYDGSKNTDANGYSCGYKPDTNQLFKEEIAISYGKLCGFKRRPDNYTVGLKKYYGYNHTKADFYLVLEHGFGTNKKERNWMFANIDNIAKHHVSLIVKFLKDLKA